jgi:hypothetical protein
MVVVRPHQNLMNVVVVDMSHLGVLLVAEFQESSHLPEPFALV